MCGIAGIITHSPLADIEGQIRKMNSCMAHRGPDAENIFIDNTSRLALGHKRLSIIDLTDAANQPFTDNNRRYSIVFNGEIYNYKELKSEITSYEFKTNSDTEVLLAAYITWGIKFIEKLKGMFAFAIYDNISENLLIVRDRFGVKPLYYHQSDSALYFASEQRSLLSVKPGLRKLNGNSLFNYLTYQAVIAPSTLIQQVHQLPAGHYLVWSKGGIDITEYYNISLKQRDIEETTKDAIHKKIRSLLFASVERRLVSDVPLGAFLSGGIDSSAIVALMSEIGNGNTNAFTVGFDEKEFDETPFAEIIASRYNVNHTKIKLKANDFLDALPKALDSLDSPSADGLNTYVVSRAIRESGITVALSGLGGDELFAGYPIFSSFQKLQKYKRLSAATRPLRSLVAGLFGKKQQRKSRIREMLSLPDFNIENVYPILRQIQSGRSIERLTENLLSAEPVDEVKVQLQSNASSIHRFEPISQVSIAEYMGYTQHVLLKDTDQMSMANSLEIREPFFDHDLIEYVLNVPDSIKTPTYSKSLLVESLSPMIPDEIVHRRKMGFVIPYDRWLRKELKDFSEEKIRSLAERDIINGKALINYWKDFLSNQHGIRSTDIWIFIVLEHWLNRNNIT